MIFGVWVIYLIDALFEGETSLILLILALICTPIGAGLFYWRFNLIRQAFTNGSEIAGRVVEIQTISTGKRRRDYIIEYEYAVNGQTRRSRNRVKKSSFAQALKVGQAVSLFVHANNPNAAFIKDLYIVFL